MLLTYLARRLALAIIALVGVVLVAFLVAHMVPADPLAVVLSDQATKDPSIRAAYVKRWGLDRSLPEQFGAYLANVLRGDLGESFTTRRPVLRDLAQFMPATIELSLAALVVSLVFGIPLGVWAAIRHNRAPDHATRVVALVGAASPIFWTGLIALYVFYYVLEWAPGPGRLDTHLSYPPRVTGFLLVDSLFAGNGEVFASALGHIVLPALVLGWFIMGIVSRTTRAAVLEVLVTEYVRTARAKGLGEATVVGSHALRNALIPIVTIVGLNFASLLSGAVLTETVFAWPGLGRYAVTASTRLDYPAILGVTMVTAVIYLAVNLAVDVLYGLLDPRVPGAMTVGVAARKWLPVARAAAGRRPFRHGALLAGVLIVGAWVGVAILAPVLAPHSPLDLDVMNRLEPPSRAHLLGTDDAGRDNLSRLLYGARITIPIAFAVILVASVVGTAVGAVSGYAGGRVDEALMRLVDIVLAFPSILLAMAITAALGAGLRHAMLAIVLVSWPEFGRLMRGQVLAVKSHEYVVAAQALGAPGARVLLTHVLPNAFPPILVKGTLDVGNAIIVTAALSFIGLGAVPPAPEWGAMIAAGQAKFEYWWVATFPGLAILSVVLGFNFLGDGLQDLLNPRLRRD